MAKYGQQRRRVCDMLRIPTRETTRAVEMLPATDLRVV